MSSRRVCLGSARLGFEPLCGIPASRYWIELRLMYLVRVRVGVRVRVSEAVRVSEVRVRVS